jgi:hypothetical protein
MRPLYLQVMKKQIVSALFLALVLCTPLSSRAASSASLEELVHALSELVQTYRASMGLPSVLGASTSIDDYLAGLRKQMKAIQDSDTTAGKTYSGPGGTYILLLNGSTGTTKDITEEAARDNCSLNKKNNPTAAISCTWNGKELLVTVAQSVPGGAISFAGTEWVVEPFRFVVSGIPDSMYKGVTATGSYFANFYLLNEAGKKYSVSGSFEETQNSSYPQIKSAYLWFSSSNPPKGKYGLYLDIVGKKPGSTYEYDLDHPAFTATTGIFPYPFGGAKVSASMAPSCSISANPVSAVLGEKVKISWTSENTAKLRWVKDTSGKDNLKTPSRPSKLEGSVMVKMTVLGNPSLTMKATTKTGESVTCSIVIPVSEK